MREETSPASWASYDELEIQMDTLQIAKEQVISLDHVADGIRGLRLAFVNVFAVTHLDSSWTLVDAALPFTARLIRNWAEKHFNWPPNAIVLTHGHFDHVSAAGELAREWDVPIYAHPMEFPYLTGISEYPAPDVDVGGGLMSLVSPLYPRGPVNLSDWLRELPADGSGISALAQLPGWQVLHTPGHSPGHVSFYRPEDRALIVGDAFARRSRSRSSKWHWRNSRSCMGHQATSPRTGSTRGGRYSDWPSWSRGSCYQDTEDRWLESLSRKHYIGWRKSLGRWRLRRRRWREKAR